MSNRKSLESFLFVIRKTKLEDRKDLMCLKGPDGGHVESSLISQLYGGSNELRDHLKPGTL